MLDLLKNINGFVWGIPTLLLILGSGLFFSLKSGFFQIFHFPQAICLFVRKLRPEKNKTGGISPYQALCTALAATVLLPLVVPGLFFGCGYAHLWV